MTPYWLVAACLGSAVPAFVAGRVTAPDKVVQERLAFTGPLGERLDPALIVANNEKSSHASPTVAGSDAAPALPDKQAQIIHLLNRLKNSDMSELNSDVIALIAWSGSATRDDLEMFMAFGKEILPEKGGPRDAILPLAFTRWVELDAASAFEAYMALDAGDRTAEITNILFGNWVLQGSPREAIDHALALQRVSAEQDPGSTQDTIVGDMLRKLAKKDPEQARQIAMEFARSSDPHEQKAAMQSAGALLTGILKQRGPDDTLAWIESWPAANIRERLRRSLAEQLLAGDETSRHAGIAIFSQLAYPDRDLIERVAEQKVASNAAEAQAWALAISPGETRSAAVMKVMDTLKAADRMGEIVQWLSTTPRQADLDPAYTQLALLAFENTEALPATVQWTSRITDPQTALQTRGALIEQWLSLDRERATEVLGSAMENALLAKPR